MKDLQLCANSLGFVIQTLTGLIRADGTKYRITVKRWRESRSLSQNALYWVWMGEIAQQYKVESDYFDSEIWHEIFKRYYCPERVIPIPNAPPIKIKSTTKLDVGEMQYYMNRIEQWAMDKMIMLTIPEDSDYSELQRESER